jgi:UDP-N-acetylmuramoyl-tripeptide--D-alanyl-D-alanine ligase
MATPIPANAAALSAWSAAAATGGQLVLAADEGAFARGITSDSRAVTPGCAFVALRGARHDGHDYVDAAVQRGAVLVIVEKGRRPTAASVDVVEVDDTLVAWGELARAHLRWWRREQGPSCVLAVTGSTGKTTTKELCAALLRTIGPCHAASGNLNNRVGVPAVAFGLEPRHHYAVFEVGMSVRGEIAELARILEPDIAVVTNVGVAHAEGVGGTRADVAREKGDLLAGLSEGAAVVCFDDAAAMGQVARTRARRVRTFGIGQGADYRLLERAVTGLDGARLLIAREPLGSVVSVHFPLLGDVAAVDLVAALAAVDLVAGPLDADAIGAALHALELPPGRMQVRQLADGTTVLDDSYNANPQSVRAALRTLAEVAQRRRAVVVLGEMRELGSIAEREHAALGTAIADSGAHLALSCGGLADIAVLAAEQAGVAVQRGANTEDAARRATLIVRPGDVVLVKASRGVGAERVVDALVRGGGGEAGEDARERTG